MTSDAADAERWANHAGAAAKEARILRAERDALAERVRVADRLIIELERAIETLRPRLDQTTLIQFVEDAAIAIGRAGQALAPASTPQCRIEGPDFDDLGYCTFCGRRDGHGASTSTPPRDQGER